VLVVASHDGEHRGRPAVQREEKSFADHDVAAIPADAPFPGNSTYQRDVQHSLRTTDGRQRLALNIRSLAREPLELRPAIVIDRHHILQDIQVGGREIEIDPDEFTRPDACRNVRQADAAEHMLVEIEILRDDTRHRHHACGGSVGSHGAPASREGYC
jgi:hypothetical protein